MEGSPHTVGGVFNCCLNVLSSLEFSPRTVGDDFYCDANKLTTLEGGPISVVGNVLCSNNCLTNLVGCPINIGGSLHISFNNLISTYAGDISINLNGDFIFGLNKLKRPNLEYMEAKPEDFRMILKYQQYYMIWNDDQTLNDENYKDLIAEIEEGLE